MSDEHTPATAETPAPTSDPSPPADGMPQEGEGLSLKAKAIIAVILAVVGSGAIWLDTKMCKQDWAQPKLDGVENDDPSGRTKLVHVGCVMSQRGKLYSWTAKLGDKTISWTQPKDEEAEDHQVPESSPIRQMGRDSTKVGFLGSDARSLWGGSYKRRSYKWVVYLIDTEARNLELEGVFRCPVAGDIKFKYSIDLSK